MNETRQSPQSEPEQIVTCHIVQPYLIAKNRHSFSRKVIAKVNENVPKVFNVNQISGTYFMTNKKPS